MPGWGAVPGNRPAPALLCHGCFSRALLRGVLGEAETAGGRARRGHCLGIRTCLNRGFSYGCVEGEGCGRLSPCKQERENGEQLWSAEHADQGRAEPGERVPAWSHILPLHQVFMSSGSFSPAPLLWEERAWLRGSLETLVK